MVGWAGPSPTQVSRFREKELAPWGRGQGRGGGRFGAEIGGGLAGLAVGGLGLGGGPAGAGVAEAVVGAGELADDDAVTPVGGVEEAAIADVDADVGDAALVGVAEEHQVAGPQVARGDRHALGGLLRGGARQGPALPAGR